MRYCMGAFIQEHSWHIRLGRFGVLSLISDTVSAFSFAVTVCRYIAAILPKRVLRRATLLTGPFTLAKGQKQSGTPLFSVLPFKGIHSGAFMSYFAQFCCRGADGSPVEACGDRSVIRLDGRIRRETMEALAEQECKERGYVAWQLIKGESLLRAKPITKVASIYY